jgi:hypothetical protein
VALFQALDNLLHLTVPAEEDLALFFMERPEPRVRPFDL